jgi:hypothetical protein
MSREVPPSGNKRVDNLRKLLYRYALALTLAVAAIAALILSFADRKVSTGDKLTQIGTGLAASVIFALIYTLLANREYTELIRTEITDQLNNNRKETLKEIRHLNVLFLPTDQYPASKDFDLRFNKDLNRDLCSSSFYYFRGTSAKYIPARLEACTHNLEKVQVILLELTNPAAMDARARDRQRRPGDGGHTSSEIRDEILLGLVALFDCRKESDIEIGFTKITSPLRVEIFGDAIYRSPYRTPESQRNIHPETARFSNASQTYHIDREEFRRQFDLSSPHRFRSHDTDKDLCDFITTLGFPGIGIAELEVQRQAYKEFIGPFKESLARIGFSNE